MSNFSKHYLAGWKWAQAKAQSTKRSFIWDDASPKYLKKLGMEGWLDSDKYSLSDVAREHTRKAKEIAEEFEAGAKAAFDDWRDYQRYEGRYADRESGDPLIRTPNTGLFSQSAEESAQELAREFHGRENRETTEFVIANHYPKDLAQLGILIELQVIVEGEDYLPINFAPEYPDEDSEDNVLVASTKKQIYFIGGDQEYDLDEFSEATGIEFSEDELEKDEVVLGEVKAIAYFADKHHLQGPKAQTKGIPYQHEFAINEQTGEQIGEFPTLVYNQRDKIFKLVGGSYEILPEGISG